MKLRIVFELEAANVFFVYQKDGPRAKTASRDVELPYLPLVGMHFTFPLVTALTREMGLTGVVHQLAHSFEDGATEVQLKSVAPQIDEAFLGEELILQGEWELEDTKRADTE